MLYNTRITSVKGVIMSVNNVSFSGSYAKTPNGNYYKKKNTGKRIGTMLGIAAGVGLATLPTCQVGAMSVGLKLFPKNPMKMFATTYGVLGAGIVAVSLICRALGAIPDRVANKKRIAKADHIA